MIFDGGHCPTCGVRVNVITTHEGTSSYAPMRDCVDVFVCPLGHPVPFVLEHECAECEARVLYVPHAVELELRRVIEQLRARLEP
jgi:hypothetical protein